MAQIERHQLTAIAQCNGFHKTSVKKGQKNKSTKGVSRAKQQLVIFFSLIFSKINYTTFPSLKIVQRLLP